jgi:hypothetical protein
MKLVATMVPFGILEVANGVLTILFGAMRLTSDCAVDCMELGAMMAEGYPNCPRVRELVIGHLQSALLLTRLPVVRHRPLRVGRDLFQVADLQLRAALLHEGDWQCINP